MRNVKSEKLNSLVEISITLFEIQALKKIVLSKPYSQDEIKSVATPKLVSGQRILQIELFSKDNKAYHRNIKDDLFENLNKLFVNYAQINIVSTAGDIQYMMSKNGKETVIGENKVRQGIDKGEYKASSDTANNKTKNYILSGNEAFLKKLAISDENGRIRDRMQAKFRQINKFIEHIEAIRDKLPKDNINIYDLCCGKSYLSFAVYHYFKNILNVNIKMICVDLKEDVIDYCSNVAKRIGFDEMEFICGDIMQYKMEHKPHLVISLHACDIATDIVIDKASDNGADVILSTPCCHHELNHKLNCPTLEFVSRHSMLRQKMCDALTDALRLLRLESKGYSVDALELIDPEDTPKNIMLRAIRKKSNSSEQLKKLSEKYEVTKKFLLGE